MNVAAKYTMCAEELSELIQACLKKLGLSTTIIQPLLTNLMLTNL